jgi:hypothetical protein
MSIRANRSIKQSSINRFLADLKLDPGDVEQITIRPGWIQVKRHLRNSNGQEYIVGAPGDPRSEPLSHGISDDELIPSVGEIATAVQSFTVVDDK